MRRLRRWVQVGAPDPWLTPVSGMAAVTALVDLLSMIKFLDMAIGQIADQGMRSGVHRWAAAGRVGHDAQLGGEDFLVGLDRQRADVPVRCSRW